MRHIKRFIIIFLLVLAMAACSAGSPAVTSATSAGQSAVSGSSQVSAASANNSAAAAGSSSVSAAAITTTAAAAAGDNFPTHEKAGDYTYDAAAAVPITLNGDSISASASGVAVEGSQVTISAAGTYSLSGSLANGQVIVNAAGKDTVRLVLNGVDINSSSAAPVYIMNAGKVIIVLADGTQNTLTGAGSAAAGSVGVDEPNAALYSKADLTIYGGGSLAVNGQYQDGIASKDGLIIASGAITVQAVDDGIRGKDYLVVKDGQITVSAGGDGLKSDDAADAAEQDPTKGYIQVAGGALTITAGGDALAAQTDVSITGGTFALISGGGSSQSASGDTSSKGIKGVVRVDIDGGAFQISAADDAIHSNGSVTINGGTFTIETGDDGLHADQTLTVNGGDLNITRSYEGLESALITLNNGTIHVVSSDDGVNVAAGNDGSGFPPGGQPGRAGQDTFTYTGSNYLYIRGGYLFVDAQGDGIDANGAIEMTGGVVLVNGPTQQMNGALDYDAGFKMTGGYIVATGSSGMALTTDQSSSQPSVLVYLSATQPGGTLVHIQNSAGEDVLTFAPTRDFQSLAFSSAELVQGETYTVSTGGSSTGTAQDGLYQGGSYTGGAQAVSFTITGTVTTSGTGGRGPRR